MIYSCVLGYVATDREYIAHLETMSGCDAVATSAVWDVEDTIGRPYTSSCRHFLFPYMNYFGCIVLLQGGHYSCLVLSVFSLCV